jgi:CHAT domain-containing protein
MASVARHRGDVQAAERHLRAAIAIYESKHGVGQSDEERSLFQSSFHGVYRALIELLLEQGRIEEGFEVLEASRARSLRAMLAARDLQFELDVPPEKERERRSVASEYERARQDLARAPDSQSAAAREGLEALRERLVALEAEIDRWAPRLAALREPEAMTSRDVASRLGPGTLVVAYSVGSERTAVFALAADGGLVAHLLPVGEDALRARIARWRRLAKAAEAGPRFRAEARALHELLLEPLGDRLQRAKRIVVSADGPLHGLPFAALRDARGYLVESTALVFAPSGTFYAQQGAEDGPKGWSAPAAFADPSSPSFARLPGSRREVASVAAVFPDIRSYLGPDATKDNVRSLPRTGRFVHFAVHGVANFRAPLESALVLAGDTAGREADDGLLHAWEVFERVRVDADLVTLSACDSGAGAERPGEGLIGLTRAFLYAGARSVVASLWSVGDGPAAPFMRAFYQEWAGGQSKAEALRRAQMDAIRRGQRPLRWAAFQLHGQDR